MLVVLGNSLSQSIRAYFNRASGHNGLTVIPSSISQFPSREAFSEIMGDVAGKDVAVIQSLGSVAEQSANDFAMQLLFTVATLKRYGAASVWAIVPFLAYARQDKTRTGHQDSIAADEFAKLLKAAGTDGISTVDIHSKTTADMLRAAFGDNNVDLIEPTELYLEYLQRAYHNVTVGGPDHGAHERAAAVAMGMRSPQFHVTKKRDDVAVSDTRLTNFEGDVVGRHAIIVDDIVDTGGTVLNCARKLLEEGATGVTTVMAHGVFSNGAIERLYKEKTSDNKPVISEIIVTDAIDVEPELLRLERQYRDIRSRVTVLPLNSLLSARVHAVIPHFLSLKKA